MPRSSLGGPSPDRPLLYTNVPMHVFFFHQRQTDPDSDLGTRKQELNERWDEIVRERRQIKAEKKFNLQRHDTVETELDRQRLDGWEEACLLREKELVRDDRRLELDYTTRVISRLSPDDPNLPTIKTKLMEKIAEFAAHL